MRSNRSSHQYEQVLVSNCVWIVGIRTHDFHAIFKALKWKLLNAREHQESWGARDGGGESERESQLTKINITVKYAFCWFSLVSLLLVQVHGWIRRRNNWICLPAGQKICNPSIPIRMSRPLSLNLTFDSSKIESDFVVFPRSQFLRRSFMRVDWINSNCHIIIIWKHQTKKTITTPIKHRRQFEDTLICIECVLFWTNRKLKYPHEIYFD